jgi:hypothetical protein
MNPKNVKKNIEELRKYANALNELVFQMRPFKEDKKTNAQLQMARNILNDLNYVLKNKVEPLYSEAKSKVESEIDEEYLKKLSSINAPTPQMIKSGERLLNVKRAFINKATIKKS